MEQGMEESDIEGHATHDSPETRTGGREGVGEALTGGGEAGLLSREITKSGCRRRRLSGRQHRGLALARAPRGPRAVGEPGHVRKLHAREPGEPTGRPCPRSGAGRSGKAKATSPS